MLTCDRSWVNPRYFYFHCQVRFPLSGRLSPVIHSSSFVSSYHTLSSLSVPHFPLPTLSSSLSPLSLPSFPPSYLSLPHTGSLRVVPAIWCTGPLWLLLSLWPLLLLHQKLHGRVVLYEWRTGTYVIPWVHGVAWMTHRYVRNSMGCGVAWMTLRYKL